MIFDESLLVFPSRSGLDDPPSLPPSFPSPALQAPSSRSMAPLVMSLASPPCLPPQTPTSPQHYPSFRTPSANPPSSSSSSFVRQGERPQTLMIIDQEGREGMEHEGTQGGGWHWQQQHQQQQQQQQRQQQQQWQQQQQRVVARPPSSSSTPPPSPHQDRGGGMLGGRGSSGGSTAFLPTPPPSPSIRKPASPLVPAAVLLEDVGKVEEATPIQWPLGTKVQTDGKKGRSERVRAGWEIAFRRSCALTSSSLLSNCVSPIFIISLLTLCSILTIDTGTYAGRKVCWRHGRGDRAAEQASAGK